MKKTALTFEEIQAAEKASEDRRVSRNQGFAKMHERDQAVQLLSNNAVMLWHVDKEANKREGYYTRDDGTRVELVTYPPKIPEDSFGLELRCRGCKKNNRYLFNLEEFRRWLRWG